MKNTVFIALSLIILFSNCHIEKRKYRSGFYVHTKNKNINNNISNDFAIKTYEETSLHLENSMLDEIIDTTLKETHINKSELNMNEIKIKETEPLEKSIENQVLNITNDPDTIKTINKTILNDEKIKKHKIKSWVYLLLCALLVCLIIYFYARVFSDIFGATLIWPAIILYMIFIKFNKKATINDRHKKTHWLSYLSLLTLLISPIGQSIFSFSQVPVIHTLPLIILSIFLSVLTWFIIKNKKDEYKFDVYLKTALVFSITIFLTLFLRFYVFY